MTNVTFDRFRWMQDGDGTWLLLRVPPRKAREFCETVKPDKTYDAELKEHREKRSLDSNAYAWKLMGDIAAATGVEKSQVYRGYIKEIGGNCETVCVLDSAADKLCSGWNHNGLGWLTDTFKSKIDGCTNVILYYGSSTYDTAQMSRLISLIVQDCKAQGIETMPPDELARLTEGWHEK